MTDESNTAIPHHPCRTPGTCRREQVCLDAWLCSSEVKVYEPASGWLAEDVARARARLREWGVSKYV